MKEQSNDSLLYEQKKSKGMTMYAIFLGNTPFVPPLYQSHYKYIIESIWATKLSATKGQIQVVFKQLHVWTFIFKKLLVVKHFLSLTSTVILLKQLIGFTYFPLCSNVSLLIFHHNFEKTIAWLTGCPWTFPRWPLGWEVKTTSP